MAGEKLACQCQEGIILDFTASLLSSYFIPVQEQIQSSKHFFSALNNLSFNESENSKYPI